jgi:hypothetical protein
MQWALGARNQSLTNACDGVVFNEQHVFLTPSLLLKDKRVRVPGTDVALIVVDAETPSHRHRHLEQLTASPLKPKYCE